MLRSTFCCFRGIGESGERRLWEKGVETWEHLPLARNVLSKPKWNQLRDEVALGKKALAAHVPDFFLNRLKGLSMARILPDFRDRMAFLDIETDGMRHGARVTTVCVYYGAHLCVYVRDRNLPDFIRAASGNRIWVTYNGGRFDLPVLRREFGLDLAQPHLDLMPVLRTIGGKGGLKQCEKKLGFKRELSRGVTGSEAVRLWQRYELRKDETALATLVRYNCEDVLSLEWLLAMAYNESMRHAPKGCRCIRPEAEERRMLLQQIVL